MGLLSKNKPRVSLDIGSSGVKAVELTKVKQGYELAGFAYESLGPDAVVDGAIMDAPAVAESIRRMTGKFKPKTVAYTDILQKELQLNFQEAEDLKLGGTGRSEAEMVQPLLESITDMLIMEVQKTFDFFRETYPSETMIGANGGNVRTAGPGPRSPIRRNQTLPTGGSSLSLIAHFPAAATSGLSFFIKPGGDVLLDEIITAAEAKGTARRISRPHVTTQNNQAATIHQGTPIPVQTNVNNTITTQFVTFALQLDVTPQISAAGTILMPVNVTNSQPDFARAVGGIPSVRSQSAKTLVMVPDGATAVIGGIPVDTDSIHIRQVTGLGNLPLSGTLFKETNTANSTSELLFFITPRIKPIDAISVLAPSDTNSHEQPQRR